MSTSVTRRGARFVAAAAAVAVVPVTFVALSGTASGYGSPTPKCSSATAQGAPTVGGGVTLSGIGFTPGQTVTVGGLGGAVIVTKTTKADSNGAVSVTEKLGPGKAQFTLSGTKLDAHCGLIVVGDLVITRPPTPSPVPSTPVVPPKVLAFTGADNVGDAALLGGGLLLVGGGMIAFTRKSTKGAHH